MFKLGSQLFLFFSAVWLIMLLFFSLHPVVNKRHLPSNASLNRRLIAHQEIDYDRLAEGLLGNKQDLILKELETNIKLVSTCDLPFDEPQELTLQYAAQPARKLSLDQKVEMFQLSQQTHHQGYELCAQHVQNASIDVFHQGEICGSVQLADPPNASFEYQGTQFDDSLLQSLGVSCLGCDVFLQKMGGSDYAHVKDYPRVDFLSHNPPYSLFANPSRLYEWQDSRWVEADDPKGATGPILKLMPLDQSHLQATIWAPNRDLKIKKIIDVAAPSKSEPVEMFRYIGASNATTLVVQHQNKRFKVSQGDWLLFQQGSWQKLDTIEEIEAYIQEPYRGYLFVIEEVIVDKQELKALLFNPGREKCLSIIDTF